MELIQFLESEGYYNIRQVGFRGLCGLRRFMFTVGLVEGLTRDGYAGRWCFETNAEAKESLEKLNDTD